MHSMAQLRLDQGASSLRATLGRYHYNVSTCRLDVHVTKGRADGLHVSSVGAAGELWAVIMDAGTQFTAQVCHWSQYPTLISPTLPYCYSSYCAW